MKVSLPADLAVDAEVDLGTTGGRLSSCRPVSMSACRVWIGSRPAVVDAAHQTCPYSKATRGNIDVTINLV